MFTVKDPAKRTHLPKKKNLFLPKLELGFWRWEQRESRLTQHCSFRLREKLVDGKDLKTGGSEIGLPEGGRKP